VSALVVAFLLFDGGIKVMMLEPAVEGSVQLGYPEGTVFGIGLALLVSTALYAVPRTAFLGAILLTGYLGGRGGDPGARGGPVVLVPRLLRGAWCGAGSSCATSGSGRSSRGEAQGLAGRYRSPLEPPPAVRAGSYKRET
jgi:hypothetical protein